MKAISKLVAVPLVILIMIILVSLTYNYAYNEGTKNTECSSTGPLLTSFSLEGITCQELNEQGTRIFDFTIKQTGTGLPIAFFGVLLDGMIIQENPEFSKDVLSYQIESVTEQQGSSGEHTITVFGPNGKQSKTVICP